LIVPIVGENTWLPVLERLPLFKAGSGSVLLISPHPDDETLGAGGYLAAQAKRGCPVTVVAVTDGEHAYTNYPGLGEVRVKEQEQALQILCDGQANSFVSL
jgi:GlcNAc-PI de-N-acetylase